MLTHKSQHKTLTSKVKQLNVDLDSETLTIAGGTGIDTSGSGNTLTVAIDSTVVTKTGTENFNK